MLPLIATHVPINIFMPSAVLFTTLTSLLLPLSKLPTFTVFVSWLSRLNKMQVAHLRSALCNYHKPLWSSN